MTIKKLLFRLAVLVGAYGCVELLAFSVVGVVVGTGGSLQEIEKRRDARLATAEADAPSADIGGGWHTVSLHPFLGYVGDVKASDTNDFGFLGAEVPFREDPNAFVVGITGGSVAQDFWKSSAGQLAELVGSLPEVAGRQVEVVCLAMWGYKQPQQLAAFSYFLSIGARLDVLVNIDGFNEIANGRNIGAYHEGRVHPSYPTPNVWFPLTGTLTAPENTRLVGEIGLLRQFQLSLARLGRRLEFSITANLVWSLADQIFETRVLTLSAEASRLSAETRQRIAYPQTGPRDKVEADDVTAYLADLWFRSSQITESIARGARISYYHFLQPNQYVPGSKELVGLEKELLDVEGIFGRHVASGYPHLQAAGKRLEAAGVRFFDLTPIYANETTSIYTDDCCHINEAGNRLLAERIFREIQRDFVRTRCSVAGKDAPGRPSARRCRASKPSTPSTS